MDVSGAFGMNHDHLDSFALGLRFSITNSALSHRRLSESCESFSETVIWGPLLWGTEGERKIVKEEGEWQGPEPGAAGPGVGRPKQGQRSGRGRGRPGGAGGAARA